MMTIKERSSMFRVRAVAAGFLVWAGSLAAQQSPSPTAPAPAQAAGAPSLAPRSTGRSARPSLDDRVKGLARSLDLNEAQQATVKKILEQLQRETLRLRLDPSPTGGPAIDRFRALQDRTVELIRSVLSPEQKEKYDPLAPRRLPPAPDQRSVEDWIQATTKK
jgi:hypothetical protein